MPTTRADVIAALSVHDAEALRAILDAARVPSRGATEASALAARIVDVLWWTYATPLGYVADRASFEDIVAHTARKLRAEEALASHPDVWTQLAALTRALVGQVEAAGISLDDLDPRARAHVWPDWWPTLAYGTGASGAWGARWASGYAVRFLKGPIGRLLPLLPPIAPYVGAIRAGAGAMHAVSGPLGVALSVMTINQALGSNYHRLVPLLLGVGALGPVPVEVAEEVR